MPQPTFTMSTRCAVCARKARLPSGVRPLSRTWVIPRERGLTALAGSLRKVGHSGTLDLPLGWCGRTIGTPRPEFRCPGGTRLPIIVDLVDPGPVQDVRPRGPAGARAGFAYWPTSAGQGMLRLEFGADNRGAARQRAQFAGRDHPGQVDQPAVGGQAEPLGRDVLEDLPDPVGDLVRGLGDGGLHVDDAGHERLIPVV